MGRSSFSLFFFFFSYVKMKNLEMHRGKKEMLTFIIKEILSNKKKCKSTLLNDRIESIWSVIIQRHRMVNEHKKNRFLFIACVVSQTVRLIISKNVIDRKIFSIVQIKVGLVTLFIYLSISCRTLDRVRIQLSMEKSSVFFYWSKWLKYFSQRF